MVTAIKGGFQIGLGNAQNLGNVTDAVSADSVRALLGQLKARPDFEQARSRFEFRLTQRDGQAFLQLKERNWASKLKGALNIRSEARAEERELAMKAINSRFGLRIDTLQTNEGVTGAQARAFVGGRAGKLLEIMEARDSGTLRISAEHTTRTSDQMRADLAALHERATSEGAVSQSESPLRQLFDQKVSTTITRSTVTLGADGSLTLDGSRGGSAKPEDKLETVVRFFEQASGLSRDDPQFKPLLQRVTRNDHFVFAAQTNNAMGDAVRAQFGVNGVALDMAGQNKISFADGRFTIEQRCGGNMLIGGLDFNAGSLMTGQAIGREQRFELDLEDLLKPDFDIARDAQNISSRDTL